MKRKKIALSIAALAVLGLCLGQLTYVAAGGDPIAPDRLVFRANIKPVAGGAPEFQADSAGAFYLSIKAGLEPGEYSGELVTQPGDMPAVCSCPNSDGSCICIINQISLRQLSPR